MPKTDLLKLIFHHDQRMEQLAPSSQESDNPLAMFTQPDPTYSTLYFSGTVLEDQRFGLNQIKKYPQIIGLFEQAFDTRSFKSKSMTTGLEETLNSISENAVIVINPAEKKIEIQELGMGKSLREALEKECIVLLKRKAEHGFDVQSFSKENIYLLFFYHLQAMLEPGFRFFSINGKRVHSERHFYFETWSLQKPPHGFEEVFPESVL